MSGRAAISLLAVVLGMSAVTAKEPSVTHDLIDGPGAEWRIVNDTVMGGISRSNVSRTDAETWIFAGHLSLENNGGFASTRTEPALSDLSAFDGIALRIRGDGRTYQLRLRTDDRGDGVAYKAEFETVAGEWSEVRLPFSTFEPTWRGRRVPDAPPLNTSRVRQLGLLLGDKRQADFRLEIDWIRGMNKETDGG